MYLKQKELGSAMLPSSWLARWNMLHGAHSAHRFLHERGDPCLFGGSQLLQREGDRPQGAFVEVRRVLEAERGVPRLELCALWKKQTTLPSLAYAGIPYQSLGERAGALALMIAWSRSPRARSGAGIAAICASTALSPSALSARRAAARPPSALGACSFIASSFLVRESLDRLRGLLRRLLVDVVSVDMRWSPFCRVGQGSVFPPVKQTVKRLPEISISCFEILWGN